MTDQTALDEAIKIWLSRKQYRQQMIRHLIFCDGKCFHCQNDTLNQIRAEHRYILAERQHRKPESVSQPLWNAYQFYRDHYIAPDSELAAHAEAAISPRKWYNVIDNLEDICVA